MGKVLDTLKKFQKFLKDTFTKKSKSMPQKTQGPKPPVNYGAMMEEMIKKLPEKKDQKIVAFVKEYSPDLSQKPEEKKKESLYSKIIPRDPANDRGVGEGGYSVIRKENFKPQGPEEHIYEEIALEPTNDRGVGEGGYSVIRKENFKPQGPEEHIYEEVALEPTNDRGVGEGGYSVIRKENFKPKEQKEPIYDEVPREQPKNRWDRGDEGYSVIRKENFKPKEPKYDQVTGANKPVIAPKPKLTKEFIDEMKEKSHRKNQQKKTSGPIYSKPKKER